MPATVTLPSKAEHAGGHPRRLFGGTSVLPPRSARRLIPREALLARLMQARERRCVVIQGPAGSGKTSTMLAWRKSLISLGSDVAWFSITAEDNDPNRFFDFVLASLAEIDPVLVHDATLLTRRINDDETVERWAIALVTAIARHPRELFLMLEDVHHLSDTPILKALQCLIDYAPPCLHLVFGTRSALPLSLARLRSQGQVADFGMRDLAFSPGEAERFLREHVGHLDKREVQRLHELTEGWVAGLQLFAVNLKAQRRHRSVPGPMRDAEAFANYFEHEVLANLAPEDLDMLTRMSACNRLSAALCAALMGTPRAVAKMARCLTQFDSDTLFLNQFSTPERETWYRFHPLMREVLQIRFATLPETEQRAVHATAWRWFERHGDLAEAVRHAVCADEPDAAADLVEVGAPALLAGSEIRKMAALLRLLPPEQVRQRFRLRILVGHLRLYARDLATVRRILAELDQEVERGELDQRQRFSITLLRTNLALQQDDAEAIAVLQPQVLDAITDIDEVDATVRTNFLAWMYLFNSDYESSRRALEDANWSEKTVRSALFARCLKALGHSLQGEVALAERDLRDVLEECEKHGPGHASVACMAAGLLAQTLYECNDIETLCQMLDARLDVLEHISMPDTVLRAMLTLAAGHWTARRPLDAHAVLDRLEDHALHNNLDRLQAVMLWMRVRLNLQEGEPHHAEASIARLDEIAARHAGATHRVALEIRLCAGRAHVEMCLYRHEFHQARDRLLLLIALCETAGRCRIVASLRTQLAVAEQQCNNAAAAHAQLLQALRLGHRLGLVRTLLDASAQASTMLAALLRQEGLDPVLGFYVKRLLDVSSAVPVNEARTSSARTIGLDILSRRERDVLELVAQAMPNKTIARTLGITPETVKWHLKNVYVKLHVSSRNEAAARFRAMQADG